MRKPIIAGNWKMNLTRKEARALVETLKDTCKTQAIDVVVCPPYTALQGVQGLLEGSRIGLGAQDVFWEASGAYTGEISPPMLQDAGCQYVIIGHSERRTHFGETDEAVRKKLEAVVAHEMTPIVCIGETLEEREQNKAFDVLSRQLEGALADLPGRITSRIVLAYEPVWAIGTGKTTTPEQAQEVHHMIREWVSHDLSLSVAAGMRIQYGGSVNAGNAASLLKQPDVDGALVGGASLKADAFEAIVKAGIETQSQALTS